MNSKVIEVLNKYAAIKWPKDSEPTANERLEILWECGTQCAKLDRDPHRWWDEITVIKEFRISNGEIYYIGYGWAEANRDESIFDLGWEFDEDTIEFYKPFEETVLSYKIIDINKVDDTPKE